MVFFKLPAQKLTWPDKRFLDGGLHSTLAKKKKWKSGLATGKFVNVAPLRSSENHLLRERPYPCPFLYISLSLRMVHISYGENRIGIV